MEPEETNEKPSQQKSLTWITIVFTITLLLFAILSYYLVFLYPENQVSQLGIANITEEADLINQYRTTSIQLISTLAQILGGGAVLVGIYFAWNNFELAQATLKSDQEKFQKNFELAQEGQITERFTRAIDQLGACDKEGNPAIEIRLGGIYALGRIANESDTDYWPIIEILTVYVKKNSGIEVIENKNMDRFTEIQNRESTKKGISEIRKISFDIQAILTVLGRRKRKFGEKKKYKKEESKLDLNNTYLNGIELPGAHFEYALFENAYFQKAKFHSEVNFQSANFQSAIFQSAHFEGADLWGVNFVAAYLRYAHLEGARLNFANLELAVLMEAHLNGADLGGANLKDANLEGADLEGAKNLTVDQLSKVETLYNVKNLDEELEKPLREKYPALFEKPDEL